MRRRAGILVVVGTAALLLAQTALAKGSKTFDDSTGENPAAHDIARVNISNEDDGGLSFSILWASIGEPPADTVVVLLLDADRNRTTGDSQGVDYLLEVYPASRTHFFGRWDGRDYVAAGDVSVQNTPIGIVVFMDRSDIGNSAAFDFVVGTVHGPEDAPVVDQAPDAGQPSWTYELVLKPVIESVRTRTTPLQPRAGRAFVVTARIRLEGGQTVVPTSLRCNARLAGRVLRGSGPGGCRFRIPANARGKRLVITVRATYRDAAPVSSRTAYRVR